MIRLIRRFTLWLLGRTISGPGSQLRAAGPIPRRPDRQDRRPDRQDRRTVRMIKLAKPAPLVEFMEGSTPYVKVHTEQVAGTDGRHGR